MPKFDIKIIITNLRSKLKNWNWKRIRLPKFRQHFRRIFSFIGSWWHVLLLALISFLFLYYPLGGFFINNIDRNTDYEINKWATV